MAYNLGNGDVATASVDVPSHCREIKRARVSSENLDSISSLPDEILQVILSLIPTKFAIRTSVLSKRWRHVWSETPSLSLLDGRLDPDSIEKVLARYTARKLISVHLCGSRLNYFPYVNSWVEFAISRNVENLLLKDFFDGIPDFLYMSSSLKRLDVQLHYSGIDPKCSVSWTSLKILSLHSCNLFEESFARVLSGSPVLETLRLYSCDELFVLDLSKSPRLKILEIETESWLQGAKIVAPYIHSFKFRFTDTHFPYTIVDVSSLIEADLDVESDFESPQTVIKMLEKLQNVEKLTFGENFLKVLSFDDFPDFRFPKFKAKVLKIETTITRYAISGIARMLQHSPELKKLIVHTMDRKIEREYTRDVELNGWNPYQFWGWKAEEFENFYARNVESKHVALFIELVLKTTKTLEKMVVRLGRYRNARVFKEVLQMVPMLSNDNNVSIVLISTKSRIRQTKWSS